MKHHPGAVGRKPQHSAVTRPGVATPMRGLRACAPRAKEGGTAGAALSSLRRNDDSPPEELDDTAAVPPGARPGRPARDGARRARFLAREQGLRQDPRTVRRTPRVGVLRGTAHRQRHARRPPHRGPRLQGRLPPLPDHARLPRGPQGRLGLPRPAGRARRREGTRLHAARRTSRRTASPSSTTSAASP